MSNRIDTIRAREALPLRREPYWHRVRRGCYIGVRRMSDTSPGTWLVRHRDPASGKHEIHSLGYLDNVRPAERFETAMALAEPWFAERDAGGDGDGELVTVAQACADYTKHLEDAGRSGAARDVSGRFRRWVYADRDFASTPLIKLTPVLIDAWRARLAHASARPSDGAPVSAEPARSASSLNRDMTSLRAALNLAVENGHVTDDRAWRRKLRPIPNADGRRTLYLDGNQRRALIDHAPADLATFLRGLTLVPIRPGEMAALVASDFDPRLSTLTIRGDHARGIRRIVLPEATAAFFRRQCSGKPAHAPLFGRTDGTAWTRDAWKKPLKQAALAAGLPTDTVAYSLRHAAITDLISLHGLDTLTVAQIAGTSLPMIEKTYGHLLLDKARSALARLALTI